MISIIITAYEGERNPNISTLTLQTQTFNDFEVIHVEAKDKEGVPQTRNQAVSQAKGNYLLFCDPDIHFYSNALQVLHDTLLANPSCAYSYGMYSIGNKIYCTRFFSTEILNEISLTSLIRRDEFVEFNSTSDSDYWKTLHALGKKGIFCERILFTKEKE